MTLFHSYKNILILFLLLFILFYFVNGEDVSISISIFS